MAALFSLPFFVGSGRFGSVRFCFSGNTGLQRGRRGSIYLTKSQTLDLRKLNIATVPCVAVSRNLQGGRIMILSKSMSNLVAVICEEHIYFVHLL